MPSQQPHAGDVIRRPGFQRKTSCGHAALDIRDRKISHQGPRARLPKTRRQPETGGRVCRYGGGRSLAMVKNLRDKKVYWSLYESLKRYLESISQKPTEQLSA